MTINTTTKRIHAVRIGQGEDREWSYAKEYGGEILEQSAASFQGGDLTSFSYWVMKNITYPQKAIKKNIQGRVVLSFVVDKDGTLPTKDIKVLKTPHPMLSNEVKRVIYSSPEWTPGTINEHPVRIKYTLPIMFKFQ